jgi:hypothetical protein
MTKYIAMRHVEWTNYFAFLWHTNHVAEEIEKNFDYTPDKQNKFGLVRYWKNTAYTREEINIVFNLIKKKYLSRGETINIDQVIIPYDQSADEQMSDHM